MKFINLIFLFLFFSCQHQEKSKQAPEIKSDAPVQSDLETRLTQQIEKIQQSTPAQRRQELLRFIELADQVDGASGEIYGNFAFEYVEEHPADFFSVLEVGDSALVKKWAKASASEMEILGDTPEGIDSVLVEVNSNHLKKLKGSRPQIHALDQQYRNQLKINLPKE